MLNNVQVADDFGVEAQENTVTMQDVVKGIATQTYVVDDESYEQCITDLQAVTCEKVAEGFDAADPNYYDNIENMIPEGEGTCSTVF